MIKLDPKDPAEEFAVDFDFSAVLDSITGATVTEEEIPAYAPASTVLTGIPQISGKKVLHMVSGGTAGNDYKFTCTATDGTETYVLTSLLPVREA